MNFSGHVSNSCSALTLHTHTHTNTTHTKLGWKLSIHHNYAIIAYLQGLHKALPIFYSLTDSPVSNHWTKLVRGLLKTSTHWLATTVKYLHTSTYLFTIWLCDIYNRVTHKYFFLCSHLNSGFAAAQRAYTSVSDVIALPVNHINHWMQQFYAFSNDN